MEKEYQKIFKSDIEQMTFEQIHNLSAFLSNEREINFVRETTDIKKAKVMLDNLIFKL